MKSNKDIPENELSKIAFDCHVNGVYTCYTFKELLEILKTFHLFWPLPKDTYLWNVGGYNDHSNVCGVTGTKAMQFALKPHIQETPYTQGQAEKDIEGKIIDDRILLTSWVAKFHSIFRSNEIKEVKTYAGKIIKRRKLALPRKYWPLQYITVPAGPYSMWAAYRLNAGLNIIVVSGVTKECGYNNEDIPWERLMDRFSSRGD